MNAKGFVIGKMLFSGLFDSCMLRYSIYKPGEEAKRNAVDYANNSLLANHTS